jgi:hypothetical protein
MVEPLRGWTIVNLLQIDNPKVGRVIVLTRVKIHFSEFCLSNNPSTTEARIKITDPIPPLFECNTG